MPWGVEDEDESEDEDEIWLRLRRSGISVDSVLKDGHGSPLRLGLGCGFAALGFPWS